eukprot:g76744.t1
MPWFFKYFKGHWTVCVRAPDVRQSGHLACVLCMRSSRSSTPNLISKPNIVTFLPQPAPDPRLALDLGLGAMGLEGGTGERPHRDAATQFTDGSARVDVLTDLLVLGHGSRQEPDLCPRRWSGLPVMGLPVMGSPVAESVLSGGA